ncbi:MAG: baseplate hub protein [Janthinobacterium lividum]
MSFTQKHLQFDFSLAYGNFGSGGNSYSVKGLRAHVEIQKAGGVSLSAANISIYGLPLSVMNQLSTFGKVLTDQGRNHITVSAWEDGQSPTVVYVGDIYTAFMEGQAQPDVSFHVEANVGLYAQAKPVQPTSQPGSQDVAALMSTMAQKAGFAFENNGVNLKIQNPYYPGTAMQQIKALVEHAGIEHIMDNGTLSIWPAGSNRSGDPVLISPQTGLVAYPTFNSQGIIVRTLWQPTLDFGKLIQVQSSIQPACGTWRVYKLTYSLASETPNGPWFQDVWAGAPDQTVVS